MDAVKESRRYPDLAATGELAERVKLALSSLSDCDLCARACHVDRLTSLRGVACRTGRYARVASFGPHHGEEACLSGTRGSGTIFFSWCNLRCDFCQNQDIARTGAGDEMSADELAAVMLGLQRAGCHNINFVSPSHVVTQILEAVEIATAQGLTIPLVYNTGGYDSAAALALLDGVIDIYMPDIKYADSEIARQWSHVRDYVAVNRAAVLEMHRQVGDLILDDEGLARRGLLVRHLVLPGNLAGSEETARFLATRVSPATFVNVMAQYRPAFKAIGHPTMGRRLSWSEYQAGVAAFTGAGLTRSSS